MELKKCNQLAQLSAGWKDGQSCVVCHDAGWCKEGGCVDRDPGSNSVQSRFLRNLWGRPA